MTWWVFQPLCLQFIEIINQFTEMVNRCLRNGYGKIKSSKLKSGRCPELFQLTMQDVTKLKRRASCFWMKLFVSVLNSNTSDKCLICKMGFGEDLTCTNMVRSISFRSKYHESPISSWSQCIGFHCYGDRGNNFLYLLKWLLTNLNAPE